MDVDSYTLTIDGDVDEELSFTFDELLAMPMIERDITLTCVSNDIGGPYVGGARWLGVRLTDLLDRAGVGSKADQIFSTDVDGFTISTPLDLATDGRDAMVVVGMNGEALPREHGFPVRLVIPGLYGFISATKWLTRLTLTTYAEQDAYWTERDWATDAPIKVASRIDTPKSFEEIKAGDTFVGGVAWAQHRGIAKVEVQVDGGAWQPAELGPIGRRRLLAPVVPALEGRLGRARPVRPRHDQGRRGADPVQGVPVPRGLQRPATNHRPRHLTPLVEVRGASTEPSRDQSASQLRTPRVRTTTEGRNVKLHKFYRTAGAATAVLTLSLGLAACGGDDAEPASASDETTSEAPMTEETPMDDGDAMADPAAQTYGDGCASVPADGDGSFNGMATAPVASAASANPLLKTLVAAVTAADLVEPLNSAPALTVFAPADPAFAAIPKADLDALLKDKKMLTTVLSHHVVAEQITPDKLSGEFETLAGDTLTINGSGESATIGDEKATVLCGNIPTANATVYVIDSVLMP